MSQLKPLEDKMFNSLLWFLFGAIAALLWVDYLLP